VSLTSKEGDRFSCHLSFHDTAEPDIILVARLIGKHVIQIPPLNLLLFNGALPLQAD
jgi:hypothetical protein